MSKREFVCGVLHLSSKVSYGSGKRNSIIKRFTAFKDFNFEGFNYKIFHIKTRKFFNARDLYCIVKFTSIKKKGEIANGTLEEYIGEVGNREAELKYIRMVCTATWANDKLFKIDQYVMHDPYEEGRCILKGCDVYSIDPAHCVDIDDAIHVRSTEGGYEVGVHIADVSSFIPAKSKLDLELTHRCQSVYLKDQQVNMLPRDFVQACSLKEGEPRRVFSVTILLDGSYDIIDVNFKHQLATITSNLSYEGAQELIDNKSIPILCTMYDIGKHMYNMAPYTNRRVYDTHAMVEVYMVLANTLVANYLAKSNKENVILRCHSGSRRVPYGSGLHIDSRLIDKANLLLSCRGEYCSGINDNLDRVAHVGLGKQLYTHFTSPIRRYIDLVVHRMLSYGGKLSYDSKGSYCDLTKHANDICRLYSKCERLSYQLDTIYKLRDLYGNVFSAMGQIIEVNDDLKIKIFIEQFDITVESILFSDKLLDLVDVTLSRSTDDLEVITLKSKSKSKSKSVISLKMFQQVKVKIAITLPLKSKLLCKIDEPNIMSLFDSDGDGSNLYYDQDGNSLILSDYNI
jgi:exoribonuclease R